MARKPKVRKVPIVNKEYVWEMIVNDETHYFKVFVGEDECITYEDDVECKHLKIMEKKQMEGLLQIDCKTKVFDEILPFQLENGIPYIKIEDEEGELKWRMSDTTKEDRIWESVAIYKKQARTSILVGLAFVAFFLVRYLINGFVGEWDMSLVFGVLCFSAAALTMVRLKGELEAMGKPFSWKLW